MTYGPQDAPSLPSFIAGLAPGTTVLLEAGTYNVGGSDQYITIANPNITIRSASGKPDDVVFDLNNQFSAGFYVQASNVTIAEITIRRVAEHAIHVVPPVNADIVKFRAHRIIVEDTGRQAIKINPPGTMAGSTYADDGEISCSVIRLTDLGRANVKPSGNLCGAGGIYAHATRGWIVRDNRIEGIWCNSLFASHAITFQSNARDTVVERNVIVDCARGIAFGLGETAGGAARTYDDNPCPVAQGFVGHYGGFIRNNFIWAGRADLFTSPYAVDTGISLEQACGAQVIHNTIYTTQDPYASIDYRFSNTNATIANNIVSKNIQARDGAVGSVAGNIESAPASYFVDAATGDLHLQPNSLAVNAAAPIGTPPVDDIDREPRNDGAPDVGADEVQF